MVDPQNVHAHILLGQLLAEARHYDEALEALRDADALSPNSKFITGNVANTLLGSGAWESARKLCESSSVLQRIARARCLALAYHGLGRQTEAENELRNFTRLSGDGEAFDLAGIYAQWGNSAAALHWLTQAVQQRSPDLQLLRVDWTLDPIRNDPRFKALEQQLNFPP